MAKRHRLIADVRLVGLVALVAVACTDDGARVGSFTTAPGAEPGLELTELVTGLSGPTQIAADGEGGYVVAELNGGEREGRGRVLRFRTLPGPSEVLLEGLETPTGVAVEGGRLWVMERRRLTVGPLGDPSDRRIVLDDLPFNGRSQGTISPVAGGGILFDTSGRSVRPDSGRLELEAGSGTLWYLSEPGARPEPFATGFKHAYAHAPLGDGRWLVTEISDGRLDGVVPPDEVVVAVEGDDFGYPACVGDRTPVVEAGGDDTRCSATPSSVALLEPGSTPTGVAVAPWDPTRAFVALWNRGLVVMVDVDAVGGAVDAVLAAFDRPQHLIADGDRILVTDHAAGTITAVTLSGPG
ncbi:MAG: glucose sorbosone dehydrogenase [Ilumatobacteraceae bacterium]